MSKNPALPSPLRSRLAASLAAATLALAGCQSQVSADHPEVPSSARGARSGRGLPGSSVLFAAPPEPAPATSLFSLGPNAGATGTFADSPPASAAADAAIRMWTEWDGEPVPGLERSQRAFDRRLPVVKELFERAGLSFPPAELAFVAYKKDRQLEVWAAAEKGGKARKVATYGICAASGVLGPKRFEGDRQVPEGHYVLSYGWAESNYHLEMKVSYPNMVDKVLGPKTKPLGGEIMIHGACASIGCLAMGDERAEELWVMMKTLGDARVKVQIYPARDMASLLQDPELAAHRSFWQNLKEGRDFLEREGRLPVVKADWRGVYTYE